MPLFIHSPKVQLTYMVKFYSNLAPLVMQLISAYACAGELNFSTTTADVAENATTLTVTVARTGDASGAASVTILSANGTAVSPIDYGAVSTTLNWIAGDSTAKSFDVTVNDNEILNADKTFSVRLASVTGDSVGAGSSMSITITDFEEGILQFSEATVQAAENNEVVKLVISRADGNNGTIGATVSFIDGSALKGSDYIGTDQAITLAGGVSEAVVEVVLRNDSYGEANESFSAQLSTPTGNAKIGSQATATIEIIDTDVDFATTAMKISMAAENVTQPDSIDLNQFSIIGSNQTYLEHINDITILSISGLSAYQNDSGIVEIPFGEDSFFLRPFAISRNSIQVPNGVWDWDSSTFRFVTGQGFFVDMYPAVASIEALQTELSSLSMPKLEISDLGNISIQKDQGLPKIERNENGELVLSKSFYDRWHIRPVALVSPSDTDIVGLFEAAHPTIYNHISVALYFEIDGENKMQLFTSAPVSPSELELAIRRRIGYIDVSFKEYGILTFKALLAGSERQLISIIPDYSIGKVRDFSSDLEGFYDVGDLNGDNLADYKMIYSNGDEQIFYGID